MSKLIKPIFYSNCMKQVILIRSDLKLPKGKAVAQGSHASVDAVLKADSSVVNAWRKEGMAKITLKVENEKELIKLFQAAKDEGLPCSLITDAGRTVVAPGTKTAAAIGPAEDEEIDRLTKDLKLL